MTEALAQIKAQIDSLSAPERAELVYLLLASLEPEEEGAEAAWRAELARRFAEIQMGTAIGKPADEVFADLRERYP